MSLVRGRGDAWSRVLVGLCLLAYLATALDRLAVFPAVSQDEGWNAAAPYKLATQGIYGSDLFTGYYGTERHYYQQMPLMFLLEGALFKVAGTGVFQMRLLPVFWGAVLIAATYAVGRQVADGRAAALAVLLLVALSLAGADRASGIPLLDIARINRYDIPVPVLGLLAWWALNRAERGASRLGYLLSGVLAGLAGLSHLYGVFWLLVLGLLLVVHHGPAVLRQRAPYLLVLGFALAWLPWLAYIASGWPDYMGQNRLYSDRFDLLNPRFYLDNLLHEPDRYRALNVLDPAGRLVLSRPGLWTAAFGLPAALVTLGWTGRQPAGRRALDLAIVLLVQALLFAALIKLKFYNYIIALWPMAALALAWLGVWLWDRRPARRHGPRNKVEWGPRAALLAVLALVLLEGAGGVIHQRQAAARVTPYAQFEASLAALIPAGSRVLGLETYWPGLRQFPYRTWLLPWFLSGTFHEPPIPLDQALEQAGPDVVLLDPAMGGVFQAAADPAHAYHEQYRLFRRFMARHRAVLAGVVRDPTYGNVEVYWLNRETTQR